MAQFTFLKAADDTMLEGPVGISEDRFTGFTWDRVIFLHTSLYVAMFWTFGQNC